MDSIQYETIRVLPDGRVRPTEAARFLGLSANTLANWRSNGRGPDWMRRGGRVFYPLEALQKWVSHGE